MAVPMMVSGQEVLEDIGWSQLLWSFPGPLNSFLVLHPGGISAGRRWEETMLWESWK